MLPDHGRVPQRSPVVVGTAITLQLSDRNERNAPSSEAAVVIIEHITDPRYKDDVFTFGSLAPQESSSFRCFHIEALVNVADQDVVLFSVCGEQIWGSGFPLCTLYPPGLTVQHPSAPNWEIRFDVTLDHVELGNEFGKAFIAQNQIVDAVTLVLSLKRVAVLHHDPLVEEVILHVELHPQHIRLVGLREQERIDESHDLSLFS